MGWDRSLGNVPSDDETWQEEQRAAILAGPVARWKLELGEVGDGILSGVQRSVGFRQRR